jgi:hypothetical protein
MAPLYGVSAKPFFVAIFFLIRAAIFFLRKINQFVTSTTTIALQSKSNSHVSVYYQPVVSSLRFALYVRCFVFEEEKELP